MARNYSKYVRKVVTDKNGVRRTVYVNPNTKNRTAQKSRLRKMIQSYNGMIKKLNNDFQNKPDKRGIILAVKLMATHGIRIGNEKSAKEKNTYGVSTLKKKHIKQVKGHHVLSFKGKKGVEQFIEIKSDRLNKQLAQYLSNKEGENFVDENPYEIRKYINSRLGDNYTPKDFRSMHGNIVFIKEMNRLLKKPKLKTKTDVNNELKQVMTKVAARLGNTAGVAKRSYVDSDLINSYKKKRLKK